MNLISFKNITLKNKFMYIVIAKKVLGNNHSYPIGVFTKKAKAIKSAEGHTTYRGGKYICEVHVCKPDSYTENMEDYTEIVYTTT